MPRVITRNCPNCGAPLSLKRAAKDVRCPFCTHVIHIEWTKPVNVPAPLTVYVTPEAPHLVVVLLLAGALIPVGIVTALVVLIVKSHAPAAFVGNRSVVEEVAEKTGLVPVRFPTKCGLNQELEIIGANYEGLGTLIVGDINCKIHIKDSKLKGTVVISAKNLVEVTLENSTLYGTDTAIQFDMNSKVLAKQHSLLKGDNFGLTAGLNGELSLEDSRVEGKQAAVKAGVNFGFTSKGSSLVGKEYGLWADDNLKVQLNGTQLQAERVGLRTDANLELKAQDSQISGGEVGVWGTVNSKLELESKAKITGKRYALKVGHNLELSMQGAALESEQVALCTAMNAEISARDSSLRGTLEAIRSQRKPNVLELVDTTVSGAQHFSGKGCSP